MINYLLAEGETASKLSNLWDRFVNWCATDGLRILIKLVVALVLWWVCFKIINLIFRRVEKSLANKNVDKTISQAVVGLSRKGLKLLVLIMIVTYLGVEMSSVVALITSIGVTIGLALQGSLSNFAGGVIILVMRPFKLGDWVEYNGISGTVEKIQMFYTTVVTGDNVVVVVPNGSAASTIIKNYSVKDTRRVDLTFSIAYENDFRKAKRIINKVFENNEMTLKEKGFTVRVANHNASSIDIVARAWVKSGDYWTFKFDMLEQIKLEFDRNGISIPYNQLDVHIKDDDKLPKPIDEEDTLVKEEIEIEERAHKESVEKRELDAQHKKEIEEINNKKASTKIKKFMKV